MLIVTPYMITDYDEGAADALMGLAGYKGTKEANGTSYIPIARAASEVQTTESSPALRKPEQGHKRAISSTEDAISSEPKKARLSSPPRDSQDKAEKSPPVTTVRLNSPPAPVPETAAVVTPAAATQEVASEHTKEEVVKPATPKSPEPDSITEAVSGATVAVQAPPQASPQAQENGNKEKSPVVETPVEIESASKTTVPSAELVSSEKPTDTAAAVSEPAEALKAAAPEPEATPMEVDKA
jgi:glucose repression mediator protein